MEPEIAGVPEAEPLPEQPPQQQGWTYWDALVVLVFAIGAQLALTVLGVVILAIIGALRGEGGLSTDSIARASFVLPVEIVWWVLVLWIVYRVVRARDPRPFPVAIGWLWPQQHLGVYLAGGIALAFSVAGLAFLIGMPKRKLPMEELFKDPAAAAVLAVFGVLLAPVIEELVFRGFFYTVIARRHGQVAGIAGTAAFFSLVHAPQYGFAWQILLLLCYVGAVFGSLRAATGSIIPSTLVHATYNLTLFTAAFADRFLRH